MSVTLPALLGKTWLPPLRTQTSQRRILHLSSRATCALITLVSIVDQCSSSKRYLFLSYCIRFPLSPPYSLLNPHSFLLTFIPTLISLLSSLNSHHASRLSFPLCYPFSLFPFSLFPFSLFPFSLSLVFSFSLAHFLLFSLPLSSSVSLSLSPSLPLSLSPSIPLSVSALDQFQDKLYSQFSRTR